MQLQKVPAPFLKLGMVAVITFLSSFSFTQAQKAGAGIQSVNTRNIFAYPWAWVFGIAAGMLLLVALLKGNRRKA